MEKEKLRTLKEIERSKLNPFLVADFDLRAEAVKWVKAIYKEQYDLGNFIKGSKNNLSHFNPRKQGQVTFIKRFFNLTEEDME